MLSTRRRALSFLAAVLVGATVVLVVGRAGRSQAHPTAAVARSRPRATARVPSVTGASSSASSTRAVAPPTVRRTTSTTAPSPTSTTSTTTSPAGPPWSVQQVTLDLYDPTRSSPARGASPAHAGRELRTTLRWPVSPDGRVAPGRLPFMVFAHGYDVSSATYSTMLDALARAGVIVAAPEFPGESTAYPGPAVESDLVNEPCDMEFVAAWLEQHPPAALRDALAGAPLIVGGHSDGATAAAFAGYTSSCSSVPIRAVVALSPDDVPMDGAFRFGSPPPLLDMSGTDDQVNPLSHTLALYRHVPGPAWLVTVANGSHLGTFTTDPDLPRVDAMIADFAFDVADPGAGGLARMTRTAGGRVQVESRNTS